MLLAAQIVLIKLTNGKNETCTEHNPDAEGNCKKKQDCLKCKPSFHLHSFPGSIKCKKPREALIKAVKREPFDKKGPWQPAAKDRVCSIHSFILLMDGRLMKVPYQPFFLVMKAKRKNQEEHYLESHWEKSEGR